MRQPFLCDSAVVTLLLPGRTGCLVTALLLPGRTSCLVTAVLLPGRINCLVTTLLLSEWTSCPCYRTSARTVRSSGRAAMDAPGTEKDGIPSLPQKTFPT